MPIQTPPHQSPVVDKLGKISEAWFRWFHDLITVPQDNQRTIGATYTALPSDSIIFVSGGTFTLTLPVAPVLAGKRWFVFNYGGGTVTFAASSGSVRGVSSIGNGGVTVLCDGANLGIFN